MTANQIGCILLALFVCAGIVCFVWAFPLVFAKPKPAEQQKVWILSAPSFPRYGMTRIVGVFNTELEALEGAARYHTQAWWQDEWGIPVYLISVRPLGGGLDVAAYVSDMQYLPQGLLEAIDKARLEATKALRGKA